MARFGLQSSILGGRIPHLGVPEQGFRAFSKARSNLCPSIVRVLLFQTIHIHTPKRILCGEYGTVRDSLPTSRVKSVSRVEQWEISRQQPVTMFQPALVKTTVLINASTTNQGSNLNVGFPTLDISYKDGWSRSTRAWCTKNQPFESFWQHGEQLGAG